jgi:acetylornithine deacetylase/succinyl-diaminopimelate desuccinylase-like protein
MRITWENFERETLDHLRSLIRLDTTNPPGNERIAAGYLARALSQEGIEPALIEPAPLRTNLIARIPGQDRSKTALMLSSHTDVVPVEASRWTRAPFAAELADGCIWGRGAIDMKS